MNRLVRRLRARLRRLRFEAPGYLAYWLLRPRAAGVHPDVVRETWDAVADGAHNSNTDLIAWQGQFLLCHQTSPYHMGSRRRARLRHRPLPGDAGAGRRRAGRHVQPQADLDLSRRAGRSARTHGPAERGRHVVRGDALYASYYTSPPERDITWIMGMLRPSNIRMTRIDLQALERRALS